jgi:hypothetical protein
LREAVRALVAELQEELGTKGDAADERDQRNFYYGGRELLRENLVRLEGLFAGHWLQLFDTAIGSGARRQARGPALSLDQLELVDLGDMDEQIAVKGMASRLQDACEESLFAAGRRLAHLAGKGDDALALETVLAETAHAALKESALPAPLRLEVLGGLDRRGAKIFGSVIHDVNAFLIGRRILPTVRRNYTRTQRDKVASGTADKPADAGDVFALLQRLVPGGAAGAGGAMPSGPAVQMSPEAMAAAMQRVMVSLDNLQHSLPPQSLQSANMPTTNVLREFRGSEVGQKLDHLDAVTVDIVATLFDFIFDDKSVSRSEERRVGKECRRLCRSRWSPYH